MVKIKLPSGKIFNASKCEKLQFSKNKKLARRFEGCIKKVEKSNQLKKCSRKDIRLRRKNCVIPIAICRFSVVSKVCKKSKK